MHFDPRCFADLVRLGFSSPLQILAVTSCRNFKAATIEMTTIDKTQSHEPSVRSQRAKVARNGKSPGGGGELVSARADIGTYCQYWQYLMAKCKKSHLKVFFSLFAPSILTNKLIFFFSFKKWELRSPRIFFQISRIPLIFRSNIPCPYNFLPKYPVSL